MVAFSSLGRFKACCHCGQAYRLVDALRLPRCTHSETGPPSTLFSRLLPLRLVPTFRRPFVLVKVSNLLLESFFFGFNCGLKKSIYIHLKCYHLFSICFPYGTTVMHTGFTHMGSRWVNTERALV